jgi:hypothetical protein
MFKLSVVLLLAVPTVVMVWFASLMVASLKAVGS